jgi:dimethylhistidine N-methyltransferase
VAADYTSPFELPRVQASRTVAYFPGSTLGNFAPQEAASFLARIRQIVGASGALLIGLDLKKSPQVLVPAYNDAEGVTAQFNLNILQRANRELEADFNLEDWQHSAAWNEAESRIEMRLISRRAQSVRVGGREFRFGAGAGILTEYSHKYTLEAASGLAEQAGFAVRQAWCDASLYFSVQFWDAR